MQQTLQHTISLLARFPAALDTLLRHLPDAWTFGNEGENTWSAFDVVGHLVNADRTAWMPRLRTLLQYGESQTFDAFERSAFRQESKGKSLGQVLDEFAHGRSENLIEVAALDLQPRDLALRGTHPAFGSVTMSQLLASWAAHDLSHMHQISRIMAHQYREAVGPWGRYLGVLQCTGHSAAA